MLITIVLNIKFPAYHSRKYCLNRFDFFGIINLIWHPRTDIVLKSWTYVQFEEIYKELYIFRIKGFYDKEEKVV